MKIFWKFFENKVSSFGPFPSLVWLHDKKILIAVLRAQWWGSRVSPALAVVAGADGDLGNRIAAVVGSWQGHLMITTGGSAKDIRVSHMTLDIQNAGHDLQSAGPTARRACVTGGWSYGCLSTHCNARRETEAQDILDVKAQIAT